MKTGHWRTRRRLFALAVSATLAVAACGGGGSANSAGTLPGIAPSNSGSSAAQSSTTAGSQKASGNPVQTAAQGLLKGQGFAFKLSLGVTGAQLQQMEATDATSGTKDNLTNAELNAIAKGSITFEVHTTNGANLSTIQGSNSSDVALDIALNIGADTPFDFRVVGSTLYLKVNAQQLLTDVGEDPSKAQSLTTEANSLNSELPGLTQLAAGDWVSVDLTPLENIVKQSASKAASGNSTSSTSISPAAEKQIALSLLNALNKDATTTEIGTTSKGTEYTVTVDAGAFLSDVSSSLQGIPGVGSSFSKDESKVPAGEKATADVYEKNGQVVEVDLDLNQFDHKYTFAVPLRIQFATGINIPTPSGVTSINITPFLNDIQGELNKTAG